MRDAILGSRAGEQHLSFMVFPASSQSDDTLPAGMRAQVTLPQLSLLEVGPSSRVTETRGFSPGSCCPARNDWVSAACL
jgi:hypothetical protein